MAKKLPCPKCKKTISIDHESAEHSDNIRCNACGSTFKLTKKPNKVSPPAPIASPTTAADNDPFATSPAGGLDLAAMNFDAPEIPAAGDPFALADQFDAAHWDAMNSTNGPFGSQPIQATSNYNSGQSQLANAAKGGSRDNPKHAQKLTPQRVILIVAGAVGGVLVLLCGIGGLLFARSYMLFNADTKNMRLVALAFHNYESAYKRLPAPASVDANRKPVWSWTVAVLPFTDDKARFESFNPSSPMLSWDAPGNEILRSAAPASFKSARAGSSTSERNVFVVSALPTDDYRKLPMFVEGQYAKFSRVTDGAANTILAMQFTRYSQSWAQPGEVTIDQAYELLGKEPGGCLVVMLDGSVKWLPNATSRADFNAMVTREAGDFFSTMGKRSSDDHLPQ